MRLGVSCSRKENKTRPVPRKNETMAKKKSHIVRFEDVREKIISLRGQDVILDFAVADLYGVDTREINQAVKNNPRKFPNGWVFEINKEELDDLRSKSLTANLPSPKSRVMPKAFTERGIYMLATILKRKQNEASASKERDNERSEV